MLAFVVVSEEAVTVLIAHFCLTHYYVRNLGDLFNFFLVQSTV